MINSEWRLKLAVGGTLFLTNCFPFVLDPCLTLPTFYLVLCDQKAALWAPHQLENGERTGLCGHVLLP